MILIDDKTHLTAAGFAKEINKTERQANNYIGEGMPTTLKEGSKRRVIPFLSGIEWLVVNGYRTIDLPIKEDATYENMDAQEARRRQEVYKAEMMELQLKKEKGELISLAEIRQDVDKIVLTVRNRFLGMPTQIAAALVGLETIAEANQIVKDAVYEALTDLSRLGDLP